MSTTHDVIDIAAAEQLDRVRERGGDVRPAGRTSTAAERETHLLRLSLELQLDAMMLTLGAAAAHEPPQDSAAAGVGSAGVIDLVTPGAPSLPWRQWLEEDLELTMTLAATALALDSVLPSTLGTTTSHEDPRDVADNLLVRFESICGLLTDLLERGERSGIEQPWQPNVQRGLVRCRRRVEELQRQIEAISRAANAGSGGAPDTTHDGSWSRRGMVPAPAAEHHYLPGELLG